MSGSKGLTFQQIADLFENEDFWNDDPVNTIYIAPPEENDLTDEDSADEDSGGLLDNLSGKQLQSQAEAATVSGRNFVSVGDFNENQEFSSDEESNLPISTLKKNMKIARTKKRDLQWIKNEDIRPQTAIFPEANNADFRDMSAVDLFETFIDETIVNFLVEESNKYALHINCPNPKISSSEIKCFIGILIVSGYCDLPSRRMFWDSGEDIRNIMVHKAMRRDRFEQIMRFLHCCDNTKLDKGDKMSKLRPLINLLKKKFIQYFVPKREIDYDESMIEYFGRHGCKQFIRGKPIRFGYKTWCINTKNGYLINFEIYQGSIPNSNADDQKLYGKATAPLIALINELGPELKSLPFRFYFDNLFTSLHLVTCMNENGYGATGTIRENRVPKNCPIKSVKEMKKGARGEYDFARVKNEPLIVTRWKDNSVVTATSNVHGVFPLTSANRYSAAEKKRIAIPRPNTITNYNEFMGGTDQVDANINAYTIGVRGKKWWWPIFTWLIDVSIQNAWVLSRSTGNKISQLQFRREIAQCYLTKHQVPPKSSGRPITSTNSDSRVPENIRFDNLSHFVEYVRNSKRRRCAGVNHIEKSSAVRTQCQKCNVGLCIACFYSFHSK